MWNRLATIALAFGCLVGSVPAEESHSPQPAESTPAGSAGTSASHTNLTTAELASLEFPQQLRRLSLRNCCISDDCLARISQLTELQFLTLDESQFCEAGLARLKDLPRLKFLSLRDTGVTDAGMKHIAALKSLQTLRLDGTKLTGKGVAELSRIPSLQWLSLNQTSITDAAMTPLRENTHLKFLAVVDTAVTADGVATLQKALTSVRVRWSSGTPANAADRPGER